MDNKMAEMSCVTPFGTNCSQVSLGNFVDRSGALGSVEVFQCTRCGHAISHPPIPDVEFLYEGRGSQDYQPDARNSFSRLIKEFAFRIQARRLLRDVGGLRGRILDFGCGSGQFTRVLDEVSDEFRVSGCDFFATPPIELGSVPYLSHEALARDDELYDGVLAMHVLEHDDNTSKLIRSFLRPVRPGGVAVVEVPNVECFWTGVFGRYWDAWYLPYHRHHFSKYSLRKALEAEGLHVIAVYDVTAPTMGRTFANLFGTRNNIFWVLLGILLHPVQLFGEMLTGRRTALRAVCRIPE